MEAQQQLEIDITNEKHMIQILLNECKLSPDMFHAMFPKCHPFPSLEKDDDGFIIHSLKCVDQVYFEIIDGKVKAIHESKYTPEIGRAHV